MNKIKYDIDIMRICSVLAVIGIHVASGNLEKICIFAVPLFTMISGVLWLDENKNITYRKLWTKNIIRIVTAFMFWSVLYAVDGMETHMTCKEFLYKCLTGHYHMWFCYMIVGIYIFIPVLRKIKEDRKIYSYFVLLSIIIMIIVPFWVKIPSFSNFAYIMDLTFYRIGDGFILYFIWGDYLYNLSIKFIYRMIIYIMGIVLLVIFNCILWDSGDFHILNFLYASFVFIVIKEVVNKCVNNIERFGEKIHYISRLCFGVYLVHVMVMDKINDVIVDSTLCCQIIKIILVFLISLAIVAVIDKIPKIRKYII